MIKVYKKSNFSKFVFKEKREQRKIGEGYFPYKSTVFLTDSDF